MTIAGIDPHPIKRHKSVLQIVLAGTVIAVAVEAAQYILGLDACDIDDVLINTFGGALGALCYTGLHRLTKDTERTKTVVTAIFAIVGIPVIYLYFTRVF